MRCQVGDEKYEYIDVEIDTEEIKAYFFKNLVELGHVPTEEVLEEIADIVFNYLLDKKIIEEEPEE